MRTWSMPSSVLHFLQGYANHPDIYVCTHNTYITVPEDQIDHLAICILETEYWTNYLGTCFLALMSIQLWECEQAKSLKIKT